MSAPRIRVLEIADRLSLTVTHADGSATRWAGDAADAALVAGALTFGDTSPGGFKDLSCELLRGLRPRADEGLFDTVEAVGAGGRVAWEGRMAQLPRSASTLRPGAVGWQAHLDDDQGFQEEYVNQDLQRWQGMSVTRKIAINALPASGADGSVVPDPAGAAPAIQLEATEPWGTSTRPIVESFFDAAVPLGLLYAAWKKSNIDETDTNWAWLADLLDTVDSASGDGSVSLRAAGPGTTLVTATAATRRAARVQLSYAAVARTGSNVLHDLYWTCLAVFGRHGLPLQGAGTATTPPGLLVTDMVADVIRRAAPMLRFTTGPGGTIASDPFALSHFPNIGPGKASDWLSKLNAYLLWPWAVWEKRQFHFAQADPSTGTVWVARLSDGAQPDFDGDQAENLYNGVVVTFTDPSGRTCTVGPPGAIADRTSALLVDTDPTNPVNAHGIPRRWALLQLSLAATYTQAIQIGAVYLAETGLARRSGSITITGSIARRGAPGRWPAWAPRSGDYITIADRPGDPLRFITEKRYDHASRTATLSFGLQVQKLDAILERMGAALVGVIGT